MRMRIRLAGLLLSLTATIWVGPADALNCVGGANDGNTCVAHSTCPGGFCAAVATPTATVTVTPTRTATPTPTVTVTPTGTPTPFAPARRAERRKERDGNTAAFADTAAPRFVTIVADHGNAVDNSVMRLLAANSYRIRGIAYSAEAVGSESTITVAVGGVTIAAQSLLGVADQPNYAAIDPPVDVPPNTEVTVLTEVTGTTSGLFVALDTIP